MLQFDDLAPFIEARPAGALARRVAPEYPGHVPTVLPAEWLAPLTAASSAAKPAVVTRAERVG